MRIIVLDYPKICDSSGDWELLESWGAVERFARTSLPELLERARTADVLITHRFPFRREVLDYITRTRVILVPSDRIETLVEISIAQQLGIVVAGFADTTTPCGWIQSAAVALRAAVG